MGCHFHFFEPDVAPNERIDRLVESLLRRKAEHYLARARRGVQVRKGSIFIGGEDVGCDVHGRGAVELHVDSQASHRFAFDERDRNDVTAFA